MLDRLQQLRPSVMNACYMQRDLDGEFEFLCGVEKFSVLNLQQAARGIVLLVQTRLKVVINLCCSAYTTSTAEAEESLITPTLVGDVWEHLMEPRDECSDFAIVRRVSDGSSSPTFDYQ